MIIKTKYLLLVGLLICCWFSTVAQLKLSVDMGIGGVSNLEGMLSIDGSRASTVQGIPSYGVQSTFNLQRELSSKFSYDVHLGVYSARSVFLSESQPNFYVSESGFQASPIGLTYWKPITRDYKSEASHQHYLTVGLDVFANYTTMRDTANENSRFFIQEGNAWETKYIKYGVGIDLAYSILPKDKDSDVRFGHAFGIRGSFEINLLTTSRAVNNRIPANFCSLIFYRFYLAPSKDKLF